VKGKAIAYSLNALNPPPSPPSPFVVLNYFPMLTIRLVNFGKKNAPAFRIVANSEVLGFFNPQNTPPKLQLDKGRIEWWVNHGAQLSPAVSKLLAGKYEFKPYVPKKPEQASSQPAVPASSEAPPQSVVDSSKAIPESEPKSEPEASASETIA